MSDASTIQLALPWQQRQWQQVLQQLQQGRLAHALLLAGPQGTGKGQFATALSSLLVCSEPVAGHNCGNCRSCSMYGAGSHGDLLELGLEQGKKAISIAQVRELVEFTTKTASLGLRRVVVVAPAEAMTTAAANALLKSLEEPGRDTHLLLVANRLGALPATIRSRCQVLKFPMPAPEESQAWLMSRVGDQSRSRQLLQQAYGSPLRAEQLHLDNQGDEFHDPAPVLAALRTGAISPFEAGGRLPGLELEQVIEAFRHGIEQELRDVAAAGTITQGATRGHFHCLTQLQQISQLLAGGSNPNRELLMSRVFQQVANIPVLTAPGA